MEKPETLEDFYKRKFDSIPESLHRGIGHFNIFDMEPYVGESPKPIPFTRRDFYKITFFLSGTQVQYADKVLEIKKQGLLFSNPQVPYQCASNCTAKGYFCVFNTAFFQDFTKLEQYDLFRPGGNPVFELTDEQMPIVQKYYDRLFEEINSEYAHKYDLIRAIVLEIIHFALKMQPTSNIIKQQINANKRISGLFLELLERQFPIDDNHQMVKLRSPSDFSRQLNIHVNHLNRAVKDITNKTTSKLIADRILLESKILLKQTDLSVSEIAYSLGFNEVTHFNNFFKKNLEVSPTIFRNV